MVSKPNMTVAAVIARDGRFLRVEGESRFLRVEGETARGALFNQPAGHRGPDGSPVTGVIRETLELITCCN